MVNPYNEHLLRAWRANMDVQVVGSVYGAALYVTHYICKDESQALKQVIAERLASLQQDATVKQRLIVQSIYGLTLNKLQHKLYQQFLVQKNVLYNILKVLRNPLWVKCRNFEMNIFLKISLVHSFYTTT